MANTLNETLTYLFPIAKAKARLKQDRNQIPGGNYKEVSKAKAIYEKQIKRYIFGIGFFASFIKGTDANKARNELSNALLDTKIIEGKLNNRGVSEFLLPTIHALFKSMATHWISDTKILGELVFADGENKDFVHPLNIFQYLGRLLTYVSIFMPPGIKILLFIVIFIPFFTLAFFTEMALILIDTLIFDPIRFVCEEIKQHYDNRDKEFLYLSTEEFTGVKRIFDAIESEKNLRSDEKVKLLDAKENMLLIINPEIKHQFKEYTQSLFFKRYDKRLSKIEDRYGKSQDIQIAPNYRALENMFQFYKWNTLLPKELNSIITAFCLTGLTDFEEDLDRLAPAMP